MILLRALGALGAIYGAVTGLVCPTPVREPEPGPQRDAQHEDREGLPTTGCAWTGPWPPGCLPVCVSYGDGGPIFVGYLDAPDPATRRARMAEFWREIADDIEQDA